MSIKWIKLLHKFISNLFLGVILSICVSSSVHASPLFEEPTRIIIPSATINLPVTSARIAYNTWEVSSTTASFGQGSALPGHTGNTVIFGHARKGLFANLPGVELDDLIYVFTDHEWHSYRVTEKLIVSPDNIEVIQHSTGSELTLFTCTGPGDSHRLVIKATLEF